MAHPGHGWIVYSKLEFLGIFFQLLFTDHAVVRNKLTSVINRDGYRYPTEKNRIFVPKIVCFSQYTWHVLKYGQTLHKQNLNMKLINSKSMLELPPSFQYIEFTYFHCSMRDLAIWITFLRVGCVHGGSFVSHLQPCAWFLRLFWNFSYTLLRKTPIP